MCDGAGKKALAFVRDLSLGSCYVAMTFPFAVEAKVSIAIWLDDQTKVWVHGIVISSNPGTGMGVKFIDVSRPNLLAIELFLKELSEPHSRIPPEHSYIKQMVDAKPSWSALYHKDNARTCRGLRISKIIDLQNIDSM